jgi:hypothetical protein
MNTTQSNWRQRAQDRSRQRKENERIDANKEREKQLENTAENFPLLSGVTTSVSESNPTINGFADKVRKMRDDEEKKQESINQLNHALNKEKARYNSYYVFRPHSNVSEFINKYNENEKQPVKNEDDWKSVERKSSRPKKELSEYEEQLKIDESYREDEFAKQNDDEYNPNLSYGRRDYN